jgi:asparagine synthase (glutamine-hydrolysing)
MGLTAVTATQLWHHLYLGGNLCELPTAVKRAA